MQAVEFTPGEIGGENNPKSWDVLPHESFGHFCEGVGKAPIFLIFPEAEERVTDLAEVFEDIRLILRKDSPRNGC